MKHKIHANDLKQQTLYHFNFSEYNKTKNEGVLKKTFCDFSRCKFTYAWTLLLQNQTHTSNYSSGSLF